MTLLSVPAPMEHPLSRYSGTDIRSVPDQILRIYLWTYGAWGIGLLFLFALDMTPWALTLCYPLAIWLGLLTSWWGVHTRRRARRGELGPSEVDAGVRSIGGMLAMGGAAPAIVFLAYDPMSPAGWGTTGSVGIVAGLSWAGTRLFARLPWPGSNTLALLVSWAALPLNATGALSLGFWFGWFDKVLSNPPTLP